MSLSIIKEDIYTIMSQFEGLINFLITPEINNFLKLSLALYEGKFPCILFFFEVET